MENYDWSYFLKEKFKMKSVMLGLIKSLKAKYSIQVWYAHCNISGENEDFQQTCKQEEMGIKFEYPAPDIPQQNNCIEQKFTTLFDSVCAMLNDGKVSAF